MEGPIHDRWAPSPWEVTQLPDGTLRADKILERWPGPSRPAPRDEWFIIARRLRRRDELIVAAELGAFIWFMFVFFFSIFRLGLFFGNLTGLPMGALVFGAYARYARSAWNGSTGNSLLTPFGRDEDLKNVERVVENVVRLSGTEVQAKGSGHEKYGGDYFLWRLSPEMRLYVRQSSRWSGPTIQLTSGDTASLSAFVTIKGLVLQAFLGIREGRAEMAQAGATHRPRVVE